MVKDLFDMADRYASQEEVVAAENNDRPRQNQRKDYAESSKPKGQKRKGDDLVAAAERSRPSRPPCTDDFAKVMESICPFHPKGKHSAKDCYYLKDYVEKHSKGPARDQDGPDRNPGHQAGGPVFSDPEHQLNMIYGGSDAYESKRKQKLTAREINAITPATPKYLKWSEAPITFGRADHPDHVPHPGRYPLVLDPIIRMVKLNRVLIDGGSELNILFAKTLDDMKIPRYNLNRSSSPFHGVIPGTSVIPLGQITLPVTLGTRENFRTENISFEVANFEMAYHAIFGRPTLTKFMAVPHYTYMVMKLPRPNGIITLRGDVRRSYNCDQESCTLAENIQAKAKRDSIRFTIATLQEEGKVPTKKAAKSRISSDQEFKMIMLDSSDPTKTAL